jgi:hypothetical protein
MKIMKNSTLAAVLTCGLALHATAAGIVSVTPSGSDTYGIPTWNGTAFTGMTLDYARVSGGSGGRFTNANQVVPSFGNLAPSHTDRRQQYVGYNATGTLGSGNAQLNGSTIPSYLLGLDYVLTMNDNRDNTAMQIDITTTGPGRAYLFLDTRIGDGVDQDGPTLNDLNANRTQWVLTDGWQPMITGAKPSDYLGVGDIIGLSASPNNVPNTGPNNVSSLTLNQYSEIWYLDIAGSSYSIKTMGEGYNYFGTAFAPIPEPSVLALSGLCLAAFLMRKRRV